MRKNLLIALLMALLPIIAFAQFPGEQVRRPVKKQQTTSTTPEKKRQTPKKDSEQKPEKKHQENKPDEQRPSKPSSEVIIQRLINNMVHVEGGTFTMGATSEQGSDAFKDEKPAHQVTLSSFSIGKYEVTQEEWQAVMGGDPSSFKGSKRPVESVSWNDCQEFIRKLNTMTGKRFRLPTEAEWEYAARGGNKSIGYKYAGSDNLDRVAWYDKNSGSKTHDVGQKSPNELGVYDMSGNVWEWCADWYGSYSSNSQTNPSGPSSGSYRVYRGCSWGSNARYCWVSRRDNRSPGYSFNSLGLRLAL
jgi:formylglycine-generating enzyme required for sulfatase activity